MNNKLFTLLVAVILLPFFGWMYYDWKNDAEAIPHAGVSRDILMGGKEGDTAQVQYFFHFPEPVVSHELSTGQIEALSQSGGGAEHYQGFGLTQGGDFAGGGLGV